MSSLGHSNQAYPRQRRKPTAIFSAVALTASISAVGIGVDVVPAAAATTCGNAPTGYNVIESNDAKIKGTQGNDFICAGSGNNSISGLGGDDIIIAGAGNDRVAGGKGDDTILGGPGRDKLRGGSGNDLLNGGDDDDLLKGQPGNDQLLGGAGNDDLRAGPGVDSANGESGNDVVNGQGGNDIVLGGPGDDVLRGKNGLDFLDGGDGTDRANGGRGADDCVAEELLKCESDQPDPKPPVDPEPEPEPEPDPEPEPEPEPDPDPQMTILLNSIDNVLNDHGQTHPWLLQAWDHISTSGHVEIANLPGSTAGTVQSNCSFSTQSLPRCQATVFTMDQASLTNKSVIIHELAHVYEGTLELHPTGGAFAKAQLYFDNTYGAGCDYAEVMADAMLHDVDPNAFLFYWEVGCGNAVPDQPTTEDMSTLRAGLGGGSGNAAWFDQNHTNGAQAWTAMFATSDILSFYLVTGLADEFGGYCSVNHTMVVVFDRQAGTISDDNPFADGGC